MKCTTPLKLAGGVTWSLVVAQARALQAHQPGKPSVTGEWYPAPEETVLKGGAYSGVVIGF